MNNKEVFEMIEQRRREEPEFRKNMMHFLQSAEQKENCQTMNSMRFTEERLLAL